MLPFGTKYINFVIITIKKNYEFSVKINSVLVQDSAGLLRSEKLLINTIFIGEERHQ